jgi:hypothetical protein
MVRKVETVIAAYIEEVEDIDTPSFHQWTPATLNCNVARTGKEYPGWNDSIVKIGGKNLSTIGHCQHACQSN